MWGIGVDADQLYLGAHMLTSATKKVDRGVATFTRLAHFSKLPRQVDRLYNIRNGGVGIGNVSRKVPAADIAKLNAVKRQNREGRAHGQRDGEVLDAESSSDTKGVG